MIIKRFESLTHNLEALTKYNDTVIEGLKLKNQNRNLQHRLNKANEKISKYRNLKIKYAEKEISLDELNAIILKRTRATKYEEIERKAEKKFKTKVPELTKKELNRLLKLSITERPQVLNELLERKVDENVNVILKTESLWPPEFTQQVKNEISTGISTGLNANHWANLNAAIAQTKQNEWPKFLNQYMRETITPFCRKLLIDQFINACATQPISKTCNKCGTVTFYNIRKENIHFLFQGVTVKGDCSNPQCIDGLWKFKVRHRVQISLADVIAHFAGKPRNPTKPKYLPVYRPN